MVVPWVQIYSVICSIWEEILVYQSWKIRRFWIVKVEGRRESITRIKKRKKRKKRRQRLRKLLLLQGSLKRSTRQRSEFRSFVVFSVLSLMEHEINWVLNIFLMGNGYSQFMVPSWVIWKKYLHWNTKGKTISSRYKYLAESDCPCIQNKNWRCCT